MTDVDLDGGGTYTATALGNDYTKKYFVSNGSTLDIDLDGWQILGLVVGKDVADNYEAGMANIYKTYTLNIADNSGAEISIYPQGIWDEKIGQETTAGSPFYIHAQNQPNNANKFPFYIMCDIDSFTMNWFVLKGNAISLAGQSTSTTWHIDFSEYAQSVDPAKPTIYSLHPRKGLTSRITRKGIKPQKIIISGKASTIEDQILIRRFEELRDRVEATTPTLVNFVDRTHVYLNYEFLDFKRSETAMAPSKIPFKITIQEKVD